VGERVWAESAAGGKCEGNRLHETVPAATAARPQPHRLPLLRGPRKGRESGVGTTRSVETGASLTAIPVEATRRQRSARPGFGREAQRRCCSCWIGRAAESTLFQAPGFASLGLRCAPQRTRSGGAQGRSTCGPVPHWLWRFAAPPSSPTCIPPPQRF